MLPLLPLVVIAFCFIVGAHVGYLAARVIGTGLLAVYLLVGGTAACCLTKPICRAVERIRCSYRAKILTIAVLGTVLGIILLRKLS